MSSYDASSTKSYLQAMQPMIESLEELSLVVPDEGLKIPQMKDDDGFQLNVLKSLQELFDEIEKSEIETSDSDSGENRAIDELIEEFGNFCVTSESGFTTDQLLQQVRDILQQNDSQDSIQSLLVDIFGFENFDLISSILQNQEAIMAQEKPRKMKSDSPKATPDEEIAIQVRENRRKAKSQPLEFAPSKEKYPHVFRSYESGNTVSFTGKKYSLPVGTTRQAYGKYEEIVIPYPTAKPVVVNERAIEISELDPICKGTFKNYKTLNRMQSLIYPVAYNTNENMLVCAPTGAGKTDVATLTTLSVINQFVTETVTEEGLQLDIDYESFKIVYVAPLKALAAEIVEKFTQKLGWLGIQVRELTGDMQLTKSEIIATQVIVTTPEKWDVVTRKSNGDNELVEKVKLLIIDEVHLLHEDRGSVIETLVARTLRQVESSQSMIRVVGLSATLPNFIDVADFLGVNRQVGMFYFDQSFRPVPLKQQLVGVRKQDSPRATRGAIENVAYEKLVELVEEGHQVMVFVHSRKDTAMTARSFINTAGKNEELNYFDCSESGFFERFRREMGKNRNKDVKELFQHGFGIHHAGMLRSDRNITEKMFTAGAIKVLCCTSTLAWGVNLPAAAVIIKGTQVYDSKQGGFTDLGISDVIQIFGRAGRPQYEQFGTGILCTNLEKLDHYISLITQQHPIESKLAAKLVDNLNAEISLGTVTNIDEGVQWLGYTYMNVRMKQNPFAYGIDWKELSQDPQLVQKRRNMIIEAARKLHSLQMIIYDDRSSSLVPKDLGRVASDFYLLNESVEIFNQLLNPRATEADVLSMICMSSEFDNVKARDDETNELSKLLEESTECQIAASPDTAQGKTNILLQAYITQSSVKNSALVSDLNYVAQNSARICRALFLIGLNRRWGIFSKVMLSICKSIDRRIWAWSHPLRQFDIPTDIMKQIEAKNPTIDTLRDLTVEELGDLGHNKKMGKSIHRLIDSFPYILIDAEAFPITSNVMRIHLKLDADFYWNEKYHGNAQFFWVLVEESDKSTILHVEKLIINKRQLKATHELDFMIPLSDPLPPQVVVRVISDTWIGAENTQTISFQHLIRPHNETISTRLLKLQPLPITALNNPKIESIYSKKFNYFNPMQTMAFHSLYNTNQNVFIGSPTGSGKTVVAELAIWHAFKEFPGSKVVYIAPMKALVRERVDDWRARLTGNKVVELTGDSLPEAKEIREANIVITTPEKFDGISRNWQTRKFVQQVSLIIMDEIHLLASDRGPILEIIVSRMNYISLFTNKKIRLLGMSTAVSNAMDMASWLNVGPSGLFNFPSSVRPVPLQMYIDGFPDNLAFCPLMKTMNKPAYMAIKQHSSSKPVLIFVASRRQTRLTALDLIHMCGAEENPRRFMKMSDDELEDVLARVKDEALKLSLQFGIGVHHAGLVESDRDLAHKLFEQSKIQILVATSTLAWGVNLPAYLVVIKGTQFFDPKIEAFRDMDLTDILQMMGRAGRPAYDTSGVAIVYTKESKKTFYKHFLNVGFPVESSLHRVLADHIGAEISAGTIESRQKALDFLTWTFLFRRAHNNPTYYGIEDTSNEGISKYLTELIDKVIQSLEYAKCLIVTPKLLAPTPFLKISSYYYLSHKTIGSLLSNVHRNSSFRECLQWLCEAAEYDELSTRHGETLINIEMSEKMRYPADSFGYELDFFWNPHIKAFLLLQAFMSRVDLPIADYSQDTVAVLAQSLRILQAYIDTTSELGYLSTTLTLVRVMQCIKQACWFDNGPLSILPGLSPEFVDEEEDDGKDLDKLILEEVKDSSENSNELKKLGSMSYNQLQVLANQLGVPPQKRKRFLDVASKIPTGEFNVKQSSSDTLVITLNHENTPWNQDFKVYAPKFGKSQRETWFAILCEPEFDELVLLKRASPQMVNKKGSVVCNIDIPKQLKGRMLTVMFVSDFMDITYGTTVTLKKE
ncbi:BA75_01270T0 [Komagataella pastoris]|uniref:BA75_01270T0 n=1 Tax=Komagataella pastoris TaxID=4922 RepID=A0A1B2J5B8_PICPA|nr:BA75_01270T0 [Komagataella pastoris]